MGDATSSGDIGGSEKSRPDEGPNQATTGLQKAETAAKILSWIAIPLIIGIFGWLVQNSIARQSTAKDYVALAITTLEKPPNIIDPSLRAWAVDLLNANAPVKLPLDAVARLKSGSVTLAGTSSTAIAMSPDRALVAVGDRYKRTRVFDLRTKALLKTFEEPYRAGTAGDISALAFSPDGRLLFSASADGVVMARVVVSGVAIWDYGLGRSLSVTSMSVSADGNELLLTCSGGTPGDIRLIALDTQSGKQVWLVRVPFEASPFTPGIGASPFTPGTPDSSKPSSSPSKVSVPLGQSAGPTGRP